jgi:hypothetical protein
MTSLQRIYGETVHEEYPIYFANFPPVEAVSIGDFGVLLDATFKRIGSLKQNFGLDADRSPASEELSKFEFTSRSGVSISADISAEGQEQDAKARAVTRISFSGKDGIFFSAAGCQSRGLKNELSLHQKILGLFAQKVWKPEWVVVTGTLECEALTLITSTEKGAVIEFRGQGEDRVEFGNPKVAATLKVASEKLIGTKVIGKRATPFVRLAAVRRKWPWSSHQVRVQWLAEQKPAALEKARDRLLGSGQSLDQELEIRKIEGDDDFPW